MKYQITLEVDESSESMAMQLVAIALKKKFKDQIRPVDEKEWLEISGQPFDY
jgi:hypothetical protein